MKPSPHTMRRKAFTLLETVVALGIVTVAVAAGVQANRTILHSGVVVVERSQAEMLVNDAVDILTAIDYRLDVSASTRISWNTYLGIPLGSSRVVVPYINPAVSQTNILLCMPTGRSASSGTGESCSGITTDVTFPESNLQTGVEKDQRQTLTDAYTNPDGELIVVSPSEAHTIIDATTPRVAALANDNPDDPKQRARDYYYRKIELFSSSLVQNGATLEARISVKSARTGLVSRRTVFFGN